MDLNAEVSNTRIVDLIRQKDPEGFSLLYDRYARSLYGIIFRMVNDIAATEEILSATFVRATGGIAGYRSESCSLFVWMMQIARSLCKEHNALLTVEHQVGHSGIFDLVFNKGLSVQVVSDLLSKQREECALLFRKELKNLKPEML